MIGYEYQGTIKNTNEVTALKTSILLGENYIPILSKDILNKFSITTFQDAKRVAQSIGEQNKAQLTIDLIQKHLDKEIKAGLDIVKINWEANGKVFTSTCIASKDSGIVYDNMLSNVMLVKVSTTINFKSAVPSKVTNSQTTMLDLEDWTSISWYRKDEIIASWLWGSERGNAWVERQVNGAKSSANVKSISDYHSQAFDYMTLGQSESQCTVQEGDPSTGPFGSVKFIWGMYLASPTMDISMTLKNGAYKFTINGLTSESHNSGVDLVTPSSLN
ncbi:hypothetical protein [Pedobacter nutrimenti]|uniref:hypothetical protein n=1 Tax=Pedobacter nutrimenti TaxID=1241337 RepID=UPI00292D74BF|nr:hypothetical protein [Pedobacter nutrimenti]